MKNIKKQLYYLASVIAFFSLFVTAFNYFMNSFRNIGEVKQMELNMALKPSREFAEMMSLYGDKYLDVYGQYGELSLYSLIEYNSELNRYYLDGTMLGQEKTFGTLTGIGPIPNSAAGKAEINLALNYNTFFREYCGRNPDVAWVYYTSENDFLLMYPRADDDFAYTKKLKSVPFYTIVTPENNPLGESLWTRAYLDEAGKGLMVTFSSPVYHNGTFLGVVSLDLTTATFQKIMSSSYDTFLIDEENAVIATGQNLDFSSGVKKFDTLITLSESRMQYIRDLDSDTVKRLGATYFYKYDFSAAPWTLIVKVPAYLLVAKATLVSLPLLVICFLLIRTLKASEFREKAEAAIREMAITDQLTGLKNRYFLDAMIEKEFQRADRYKRQLSVIAFDLDHFKIVNDTWGHGVGDEVLQQTARTAQNQIRGADVLIRTGGEEFLIMLPETGIKGAYEVAEKVRKALETGVHPVAGVCTASFGIADREEGETYSNLYRRADEALYRAKENGRNRVMM